MPNPPYIPEPTVQYLPQLALLVPVFVAALAVMFWRLSGGRRQSPARIALGIIGCLYAVGVVKETLLPLPVGNIVPSGGVPWHAYINLAPLQNTQFGSDMVPNALLFAPLGVLLPLLARVRTARLAALIGCLVSLSIETAQFVTDVTVRAGHVADINDVLFDTLGTLIGFLVLKFARRIPLVARVINATAWPHRSSSAAAPETRDVPGEAVRCHQHRTPPPMTRTRW